MTSRRLLTGVAVLSVATLTACGGVAGDNSGGGDGAVDDFANDPITLIIPRSAGGGYDSYGRGLVDILERHLPEGSTIVVENQAGAAGRAAAATLAEADPDGHTLLLTDPEGLLAYQMVGESSYDIREFTSFGTLAVRPSALAVAGNSPYKTFDDFQEAVKSEQLTFATTGVGSPTFLDAVLALDAMGAKPPTVVPHEGSAEAITSVVRGDSDFMVFAFDTLADQIKAGDVNALVQFSEEPLDEIVPDVPMAADFGLEELDGVLASSLVLYGPPDMPSEVEELLADAVQESIFSEEFAQWGKDASLLVTPLDREETQANIDRRRKLYEANMDLLEEYVTL